MVRAAHHCSSREQFWPLWVSSLQSISLIAHAGEIPRLFGSSARLRRHAGSELLPLLIMLMIGTYNHEMRLRLNNSDVPWKR